MRRIHEIQLTMVAFLFMLLYLIVLIPKAPGHFYDPHHIANLFLSNFGVNSQFSTLPYAGTTMITYYYLKKSIIMILDNSIILFSVVWEIINVIYRSLAYILLFSLVPQFRGVRVLFGVMFGILIVYTGIPLLMGVIVIFSILKSLTFSSSEKISMNLIFILVFSTVTLYWHSWNILTFCVLITLIFLTKLLISRNKISIIILILSSIITLSTWIYFRERKFSSIISKIDMLSNILDWKGLYLGLFSKGSFIPTQYKFKYEFIIPVEIVDIIRYLSYIVIYVTSTILFITGLRNIKNGKKEKVDINKSSTIFPVLLGTFLLSDFGFKLLYFYATGVVPSGILFLFLYPLLIMYILMSKDNPYYFKFIKKGISIFLLLTMAFTALSTIYIEYTQYPQYNTYFERYKPSFFWLSSHLHSCGRVLSDSDTSGYYQILYTKYRVFSLCLIHIRDIQYPTYDKLVKGIFRPSENTLIALNLELYRKHLVFESLRAWDKFEPLSLEITLKNNLSIIYNDYMIAILK